MATHIDDTTCSPCVSSIASSASQNKPRAVPGMSLTFELTVLGHSSVSSISSPGTLASRIGASIGLPHSSFSPTFPHSSTTADPPAPDVDTHAPCFVVSTAAHILAAAVRTHSGVGPCGSTWLTTSEISLPRWCESLGRTPGWRGENMASIALVSSVVSGGVGDIRTDAAPNARSIPRTIPPGAPFSSTPSLPETMNRTASGGEFGIHRK